jgi:hypothetical protein
MRILTKVCVVLALVALLVPATVDAQRICFSFASETNPIGPNFLGIAGGAPSLMDAGPLNPTGVVSVTMLTQPFCDFGPVTATPVDVFIEAYHWAAVQNPFVAGNFVNNWAYKGRIVFWDTTINAPFLQISFETSLLTAWSPSPTDITSTATWQDSFWTDPGIQFVSGPGLDNIMISAGFPPNLINHQPDFAFTLTNIRDLGFNVVPIPFDPGTGDYFLDWAADGSFSATAGN